MLFNIEVEMKIDEKEIWQEILYFYVLNKS